MARTDQAHSNNVDGPWFTDTRCFGCDVARHWAPGLIEADADGRSYVARQPQNADDEQAMWRAVAACPTQSVGNRDIRRPPSPPFPLEMTRGVWALGNNAADTFGAHTWLVQRPDGNLLIDIPRFTRSLADAVDSLGGVGKILLTHQDHVRGGEKWVERFSAPAWIHETEAHRAPYAGERLGDESVQLADGVTAVPIPGHTRGSVAFHVDNRILFTGDSLRWHVRRACLDVYPDQTWHSWDELAASMDVLAGLEVEWVFAGHGKWHHVGFDVYRAQLADLGDRMRRIGQADWSHRPAD